MTFPVPRIRILFGDLGDTGVWKLGIGRLHPSVYTPARKVGPESGR